MSKVVIQGRPSKPTDCPFYKEEYIDNSMKFKSVGCTLQSNHSNECNAFRPLSNLPGSRYSFSCPYLYVLPETGWD